MYALGGKLWWKRRVEYGHVGQLGKVRASGFDALQVRGVVERRQFGALADLRNHPRVDHDTVRKRFPAVHHAVADRANAPSIHALQQISEHVGVASAGAQRGLRLGAEAQRRLVGMQAIGQGIRDDFPRLRLDQRQLQR
jgi:hypothetical protein